jgi:predicted TIM-barrel fold metal-dependent hydrolase
MKRRDFLQYSASAGAVAAFLPAGILAQGKAQRIDIHHHILPPSYMQVVAARRIGTSVQWSVQKSLDEMDRNGIATSVVSLIQPGVWLGEAAQARGLAREANDYAARMVKDHPGRFGQFATLPLPDADGSLREIEYALDTLKAEGIGLMTSYGDKYLGDKVFAPVWEELNRRKAVVYTHPLSPDCCRNLVPDVPTGAIEYATDTTRTMAGLLLSGSAARYPDIRWIFSHGGGTTPFLLSRLQREEQEMKERDKRLPKGLMYELAKFHYDTAQSNHPGALAALTKIAPSSQILFGTDYPFRTGAEVVGGLGAYFKGEELRAIERGNALRLIPRLTA